ncbi:hypothetical protein GCM10011491_06720 [Brucella endophytica]|uniref:Uncharacterized protein n=1 Tax=Brucella endophytica TaxID=1963359 RepID=A0A916WB55_9HYPH|nr:hypothetical protein [Brucella endophytica]GGA81984.1 hypothetical protein GCM10011491_06720 [Brucella endophytica]
MRIFIIAIILLFVAGVGFFLFLNLYYVDPQAPAASLEHTHANPAANIIGK